MTGPDDRPEEFLPPTALESAVRALGADTIRYRVDYIMLPMRDGIRLATVVVRPRAHGRYPTLLVRSPYAAGIPDQAKPMHAAQFTKNYVLILQNERGSEWSEGDFGFLTTTTADAQDTLDWISPPTPCGATVPWRRPPAAPGPTSSSLTRTTPCSRSAATSPPTTPSAWISG